ncbi:hypothetical protein AURDEDRAFT_172618 [Auricularia subglabra TFB-10046 SS5]|nr:hypothetical protein AURDEDRAFT_172618 [Auricularia subglabra TFB-10046 SS5]
MSLGVLPAGTPWTQKMRKGVAVERNVGGRYYLTGIVLGVGAQAVVMQGSRMTDSVPFAIKMLAACKHPRVIGFEENVWDPTHDFLVMEFAACGSLEDLMTLT